MGKTGEATTPAGGAGLLDAYMDATPTNVIKDESRPVSKKNKNKKKREQREAEERRRLSESQSTHEDDLGDTAPAEGEVVDSWEDINDEAVPPAPPPTIIIKPLPKVMSWTLVQCF